MRYWWLSDFARLAAERAAVERADQEDWFELTRWTLNGYRLCAEGVITAHGASYPVRLLYPDQFPLVPAWVEPQDSEAKWSNHQYGKGGTLCLELRPDNWSSSATGADVLRSSFNLLHTENPLGAGERNSVASAHDIGEVQSYDWGIYPLIVGAGCLQRLKDGTSRNPRALRWMAADDVWPILVSDDGDRETEWRPPDEDLGTWRVALPVVVSRSDAPAEIPTDRAKLGAALAVDLTSEQLAKGPIVVIAVGHESVVPYHSTDEASVFRRKWIVLPDQGGIRSGRGKSAQGKKVAVIGAGSVGSKIAESLLRSGIHRLLLVDGDVFLPGNRERHVLDWRDVGFRKVHAVKRRLMHIAPGADVTVIAENLDWQRSARVHAAHIDEIAACDMIIDATGDAATALMLGAIALESGLGFVSVQVFEGGLGALIARSVPGVDAPYGAGRASYLAYCELMDVEPPPSGRGRYDALNEAGEPVVADDAAATVAAGHAARTALDVLDGKECSGTAAWLLVGLQPGWLFERHGHNIILDVGPPASPPEDTHDVDARAFALQLVREAVGATQDTG